MAVVSTGLSTKGLRSEFFARFNATRSIWDQLTTRVPSTSDNETYKWLGTVPNLREWGTGRLAKGLRTESYSVENLKYEATLEVDRDEIADDQTGQIRIRVQELAQRAATHKDKMIADLLKNGESAGFNAYDGKTFFATDHESGASGAQDNKLDFDISAETPNEPDTPDTPSVVTCQKAFDKALAQMMTFKDDQGEPADIDAMGLILVCAPQTMLTWMTALEATMIGNTDNMLRRLGVTVEAMSRLTDVSKWYLIKNDRPIRPFIFQDREPVEFNALAEDSEEEFKREKYLYGVRARYRITYGEWRHAVRTDFV